MRIASVPSDHVYVRHLAPVSTRAPFVVLDDGTGSVVWQPSPVLEPDWVRAHADHVDLVHVHFGFEHRTAEQLRAWVAVLAELRLPLVLTVHDLVNPHLHDQRRHTEALDVLVPAATAVTTLTPGAAAEVRERWGRRATVLPHPHVVPLDRIGRPRPSHDGVVVGLQVKERANNAHAEVEAELRRAVAGLPGGVLREPPARRLDDDELWDHLAGLDVLVLPYRFGTHSGFVEACHDLGTAVVAARTGYLAEQHEVAGFDLGVPGSLTAAVQRAGRVRGATVQERVRQRDRVAEAHAALYADAVAHRVAA